MELEKGGSGNLEEENEAIIEEGLKESNICSEKRSFKLEQLPQ